MRAGGLFGLAYPFRRALRSAFLRAIETVWQSCSFFTSDNYILRPQISETHPLNLSISISGGKETNKDSLSNGERSGKSSSLKSRVLALRRANCGLERQIVPIHWRCRS